MTKDEIAAIRRLENPYAKLTFQYPLSTEDHSLIARTIERIRVESLATFHARERGTEARAAM